MTFDPLLLYRPGENISQKFCPNWSVGEKFWEYIFGRKEKFINSKIFSFFKKISLLQISEVVLVVYKFRIFRFSEHEQFLIWNFEKKCFLNRKVFYGGNVSQKFSEILLESLRIFSTISRNFYRFWDVYEKIFLVLFFFIF